MATSPSSRLTYIDWARGLACVLMFQTHCYDAWLSPDARNSTFFMWSQIGGTFPAPLFLFLAGISVAFVVSKQSRKGVAAAEIAGSVTRRGAEVLALAFLFRLQEFVIALGWAPWSDLLRVDILNTIGVSIMLLGGLIWLASSFKPANLQLAVAVTSAVAAFVISTVSPLLWTTWRPGWLPWPLLSYVDGSHNLGQPQPGFFPLFPWSGFAFVGLAAGICLFSDRAREREATTFAVVGGGGIAIIFLARWLDSRPQLYPVYDYWNTSPNFFLIRVGFLLAILAGAFAWCRWGPGKWSFSPLAQLGRTSLLVYWVHLEFVYGKFSIMARRAQDIRTATFGLIVISLAMLLLSVLRTRLKGRGHEMLTWLRIPVKAS